MTIRRVLIANRGEIAVRVIRACQLLGIETVVATSEADRDAMPAQLADRSVCIGSSRSTDSYLNYRTIVTAARATGCDAVHPGYGLIFVGPTGDHMRKMGNKIAARTLAREAGVPTLPGSEKIGSAADAIEVAERSLAAGSARI